MQTKTPLVLVTLGLLGGYLLAHAPLGAPSARAESGPRKWEHFCFLKGAGMDELNKDANNTGKAGWELVSASAAASGGPTLMCFKRPAQ
jgi:hypothetical protein